MVHCSVPVLGTVRSSLTSCANAMSEASVSAKFACTARNHEPRTRTAPTFFLRLTHACHFCFQFWLDPLYFMLFLLSSFLYYFILYSHSMKWLCCFVSVGFELLFPVFFYLALYSFYVFLYSVSIFPTLISICCFHTFFCAYVPFFQSSDR